MTDERTSRPVSGEIMFDAAAGGGSRAPGPDADIVDADFVSLPAAPAEPRAGMPAPAPAAEAARGMDILKSASLKESNRAGPLFWIFGFVLVAGAFWVSGGHALVSRPDPAPVPAAEEDPRAGLRIVGVTSRIETTGDRSFVLVDGEVVNTGRQHATLPPLDITLTDGAGRSTRYMLGTGDRRLAPSARFPFSGRLQAPPDGVGTVTVDFRQEAG